MAGFETSEADEPIAAINVTPLVDVMLVLLVIFMVTAPMMQQGVDVNVPKATTGALKGTSEQVVISVDKDGKIYIGKGNEVPLEGLGEKMKAVMDQKKDSERKVYIKADTDLDYGRVMSVMGALHQSGISQIGLVSNPVDRRTSRVDKEDRAKEKK